MSEQQQVEWDKAKWLQSLHIGYEVEKAKRLKIAKRQQRMQIFWLFILLIVLPIVIAWVAAINF